MKHKILIATRLQNKIEIIEHIKNNPEMSSILIDIKTLKKILSERDLNPLTNLAGNLTIIKTIEDRLKHPTAILYIDLDNFKAYNDKYGFIKGDEVLKFTAQILKDNIIEPDFVGHIGGDDFIIITTPERSESLAQNICTEFDAKIPKFYNPEDLKNKKIVTLDRKNNKIEYPIMTLSIAIISNTTKPLSSVAMVSQIAAELKAYAKTKPGGVIKSNFVKERRKS